MRSSYVCLMMLSAAALIIGCGEADSPPEVTEGTESTTEPGGEPGRDPVAKSTFPCTEAGILDAIAEGGGPHFFACDGPTTVVTSAEISIDNSVVLDGRGELTVDANGEHRVFSVPAEVAVGLRGLTITGGAPDPEKDQHYGGGVRSDGTLTLKDCVVTGNHATVGGGVANTGGALSLNDSEVVSNSAQFGGGIATQDLLVVTDTLVARNVAENGYGGGIFNEMGNAIVHDASVTQNSARFGGGVFNWGTTDLTRSTVTHNQAGRHDRDWGGGIFNEFGKVYLKDTAVAVNAGGGICNCRTLVNGGGGDLELHDSTVSGNMSRGIHNVATAKMKDSDVFLNHDGGIMNEGTLEMSGCSVYGGIHMASEDAEATFYETLVQGGCTMDGEPLLTSEGHNEEGPGDTCYLDHETDRVGQSFGPAPGM